MRRRGRAGLRCCGLVWPTGEHLAPVASVAVNATGDAGVYLRNQQWFDPADAARVPGGGGESSISPSRKVSAAAVAEDALDMFG